MITLEDNIQTLRQAKGDLAERISNEIRDFQLATGLDVAGVYMRGSTVKDGVVTPTITVDVRV